MAVWSPEPWRSISRRIAFCPVAFGSAIPEDEQAYMDYMTWDKLTPDGSWGAYTESDAGVATAEAGRALLEYFVTHQGAWLEEHIRRACERKGIPA